MLFRSKEEKRKEKERKKKINVKQKEKKKQKEGWKKNKRDKLHQNYLKAQNGRLKQVTAPSHTKVFAPHRTNRRNIKLNSSHNHRGSVFCFLIVLFHFFYLSLCLSTLLSVSPLFALARRFLFPFIEVFFSFLPVLPAVAVLTPWMASQYISGSSLALSCPNVHKHSIRTPSPQ